MRGGKEAAADVRALKTATDDLKTTTQGLTTQTGAEEAALSGVGAEASRTSTILNRLGATYDSVKQRAGAAFTRLRGGMKDTGDGAEIAAGQVGNLSAQFFDIGVMMQAGQNPLQLAIQQGSQISQVIGPMGAAKAVRALGAAFMTLLSPVNLITIGSIAAGAALMSWLTSSKEEAEGLDDVLERISGRVDDYKDLAARTTDDLIERYGSAGREIQKLQRDQRTLAMADLRSDTQDLAKTITETLSSRDIRLEIAPPNRGFSRRGRDNLFDQIKASLEGIGTSGNVEGQITSVQDLLALMDQATGGIGTLTPDQDDLRELYRQLTQALENLMRMRGISQDISQTIKDQADAAAKAYIERRKMTAELEREIALSDAILQFGEHSAEVEALRADQADAVLEARLKEKGWLPRLIDQVRELSRVERERAQAVEDAAAARSANAQISQLRAEADINRAIIAYGRDSVQVKTLQIAAQRQLLEQMLATQDISEELKATWRAEWEAANGLASADPFGTMAASGEYLRQSDLRIERLRLEQQLLGQSEATQARLLALYDAEAEIHRQGLDRTSARANEVRATAVEAAELSQELARQSQAWDDVRDAGTDAIDDIVDSLTSGDLTGALESMATDLAEGFKDLAITNPLKNAVFGTELGTLQDLGGWQGIWGRLTGKDMPNPDFSSMRAFSASSMAVTAGSVVINGPLGAEPFSFGAGQGAGLTGSPAVQEQIWRYFSNKGLEPHQIAGILGNVSAESGFNPLAVGDQGTSFGLFQHHAGRGQGLLGALGGMGGLGNIEAQLDHVWQELMTTHSGALQNLLATTNVEDATSVWMRQFEIPSDNAMMTSWADRLSGAEEALTRFGTTATTAQINLGTLGQGFDVLGSALSSFQGNTGAGGGLFGNLLGALFAPGAVAANADGGYQYGPGGSRADASLIRISSGEFVVNGAATARNRGLLEWINAGGDAVSGLPAFARGGAFDAAPYPASGPREVQLVNSTGQPMSATVEDEPLPGGGRRERYVLSNLVGETLSRPGGGAPRALRNRYGVKPRGTRR